MKQAFLASAFLLNTFAGAAAGQIGPGEDIYLGPTHSCTFTDQGDLDDRYQIEVYQPFSLFQNVPAKNIRIVYSVTFADEQPDFNIIATLEKQSNSNALVYEGKMTNLDYLVDVRFDIGKGTLAITDDGETRSLDGSCSSGA